MNDELLTRALEEDRYLKAIQLINRFETELRQKLEHIGDQFVSDNRQLFDDDVEPSWNNMRSSASVIAFARVDFPSIRLESPDDGARNLKLNLSVRWVDPGELGRQDVDGALSLLSYKLKRASDQTHQRVKEQTRQEDWPVQFADDAFNNSPGIAYLPVRSAEEMHDASDILQNHFETYGSEYGVDPEDR